MSRHHKRCDRCGAQFMFDLPKKGHEGDGQGICPTPMCWALSQWTDEEWAGKARMAEVRKACGLPLNDIDAEALRRARRVAA